MGLCPASHDAASSVRVAACAHQPAPTASKSWVVGTRWALPHRWLRRHRNLRNRNASIISPQRITPEQNAIITLRKELLDTGSPTQARQLLPGTQRQGFTPPSASTIWRTSPDVGSSPRNLKTSPHLLHPFKHAPNECWRSRH